MKKTITLLPVLVVGALILVAPVAGAQSAAAKFANAHDWFVDGVKRDLPMAEPVRTDFAECNWKRIEASLTKAEIDNLDGWARGETLMSADTIDALTKAELPSNQGDFSALQPYCPEKISEFQAAMK